MAQSEFIPQNTAGIRFERAFNTFLWNLGTSCNLRGPDLVLSLNENYNSSLIRRDHNSFRDEQTFGIAMQQKVAEGLFAATDVASLVLSDNQSMNGSIAAIHTALAGFGFRPFDGFQVTPLAGFRYDRQQDYIDKGWSYKITGETDTLDVAGYQTYLQARINQSDLTSRTFRNNGATATIQKDFGEGSSDSIRAKWIQTRSDFYVPADNQVQREFGVASNIRSRSEDGYGVFNALAYGAGQPVSAILVTGVESRTVTNGYRYRSFLVPDQIPFDSRVNEFTLNASFDLVYQNYLGTRASAGIVVSERDEKRAALDPNIRDAGVYAAYLRTSRKESQLDNNARRTLLRGMLEMPLTASDAISFDGSAGILRYDTPDTLNTDDRDELLITAVLRERHQFSKFLELSVEAEATLAHTVYLFEERSANNSWNRIFRLMPEIRYRPIENLSSVNRFEVLANYTAFDFESTFSTVQSYVYRQFAFLDSTSYDMTRRLGADIFFSVRLMERGELQWAEFKERPRQFVEEATFSPRLRCRISASFSCALGFRSYAQKRYTMDQDVRKYEGGYFSYGPTTSVSVALSPDSRLELQGWKEYQQQNGRYFQSVTNMTMSARIFF
ncbi:MAG: hypothetical protein NTV54_14175 [Ignavibacteriales bacterium]|nr:hypothetical protein [Ignavibacteriales bacterium]